MVDKYRMSGHKLEWHQDRTKPWYNKQRISPIHIELGITTACNLNCLGCYGQEIGRTLHGKPYHMPKDTAINLFKDSQKAGIKSITLIGEGEDTIHPNFYEILENRPEELDLGIATNATALKEGKMEDFLRSFIWIRNSIWGADKESYIQMHRRDKFDKVIYNIQKQVEIKNKKNLTTTIGMQQVVRSENIDQIVPLAKLGRELGVDYFVTKPCADTPDGKFGISYEELRNQENVFKEAEKFATENYKVVIKRDKFQSGNKHPYKTCYGTEFVIAIDAHGNVAPCGHLLGYRKEDFNAGNINENSLAEIINSERYWEVQAKVKELDLDKECETNCLHYHMNQYLEDLKEGKTQLKKPEGNIPPHINFP